MLHAFLTWWLQRLGELVPARLRPGTGQAMHALLIDPDPHGSGVALSLRRDGQEGRLGHVSFDPAGHLALGSMLSGIAGRPPAVLRLPQGTVLERSVALPLAAERDPEQALRYEMDRLTPFTADEVYWDWSIERRDRVRNRLHLRLALVPKAGLAPLLADLAAAGLPPAALEFVTPQGARRPISLDHADTRKVHGRARLRLAGGAVCATLALVAVMLPFGLQSLALGRVGSHIDALRPRVTQAEALRRRITAQVAGTDVVAAERARDGDALEILAAITDRLSDDTFLTDLTLRQRKLSIAGQSAVASRLIGALSADPTIRNPSFSAPVTRLDGGRGDVFAIRAEIAP